MTKPTPYTTTSHRYGRTRTTPLELWWEVRGDPMSDDYDPDETHPAEVWRAWRRQFPDGILPISWFVMGGAIFEAAPGHGLGVGDFLSHYSWPIDPDGQPLRWASLPVVDKLWRPGRADKGGFIQELTGWKPSPFQSVMEVAEIEKLTRWWA